MLPKRYAEEYFFLDLGGKVGASWPGYWPGQRLTMVKEVYKRKAMMYLLGPCNTRVYFDTIAAHEILSLESRGVFYNCYYVKHYENGVLRVLMCRDNGMFRPEDILL